METFASQRFDGKIEGFEACLIDNSATHHQQDIVHTEISETTIQDEQASESETNQEESVQEVNDQQQNHETSSDELPSAQQNVTLTPVRLPAILDGEFFCVVRLEETNVTARCLQCHKLLNGNLKSTGNFLSHIKRVHPYLIDKIKTKSNQRRPAAIYIDLASQDKCVEYKQKKFKKFVKPEEPQSHENMYERVEWLETSNNKKRKSYEMEPEEMMRINHNSSIVVEDEYDAIGKNVAAKLRHMRVDQRIIAEKLINDIMYEAQLGNLCRDSSMHI